MINARILKTLKRIEINLNSVIVFHADTPVIV